MQFEYYVLNYNTNLKRVEPFNIFRNGKVNEHTEKAIKKYLRSPKKYKYIEQYECNIPELGINKEEIAFYGFDGLCMDIMQTINWQEHSRRQYEISVGDAFESDCNKLEKWDCAAQCKPNIEMIVRECLWQYKNNRKICNEVIN